jgi:hypothetical protein
MAGLIALRKIPKLNTTSRLDEYYSKLLIRTSSDSQFQCLLDSLESCNGGSGALTLWTSRDY